MLKIINGPYIRFITSIFSFFQTHPAPAPSTPLKKKGDKAFPYYGGPIIYFVIIALIEDAWCQAKIHTPRNLKNHHVIPQHFF